MPSVSAASTFVNPPQMSSSTTDRSSSGSSSTASTRVSQVGSYLTGESARRSRLCGSTGISRAMSDDGPYGCTQFFYGAAVVDDMIEVVVIEGAFGRVVKSRNVRSIYANNYSAC